MKKLLSICFLSILLGLLSFSVSAQQGGNCAGGFWIENLQPDMVNQVANGGTAGQLPLTHTLGNALRLSSGQYWGNAAYNKVEYYKLHLCSADICDTQKVSIDWELYWKNPDTGEFERVNDNLSNYAEFSIYTLYKELTNTSGVHDFIRWLGGQVPDGNGFCNPMAQPTYPQFNPGTATTPTNYPGALQTQYGCPECVMTIPGEAIASQGLTPLYTEALDYFYMGFLKQAETYVQIKWKNAGDYYLVMSIRERYDGTSWPNLHYDRDEHKLVGGHMSVCGDILYSDTIGFPVFDTLRMHVCENEPALVLGRPEAFVFDRTIPDTNVIFGTNMFVGTDCAYLDIDTMLHVSYFVRHRPAISGKDVELCACEPFDVSMFKLELDKKDLAIAIDTTIEWLKSRGTTTEHWQETPISFGRPTIANGDTTYMYIVRQVNTYLYYGDTINCEGPEDTLYRKVKSIKVPTLVMDKDDICREVIDNNTTLKITSTPDSDCGKTTRWFTKWNTAQGYTYDYLVQHPENRFTSRIIEDSEIQENGANELVVNLAGYRPSTNIDTTIYFLAISHNTTTGCDSKYFTIVPFTIHKTPEIAVTQPKAINCPGDSIAMKTSITNDPQTKYTYYWGGDVEAAIINGTNVPVVDAVNYTFDGNSTSDATLPVNQSNSYSYTQQIYTPNEIGGTGDIAKIDFKISNASWNTGTSKVQIYLMELDDVDNYFTASYQKSNFFSLDNATLVYDGAINFSKKNDWNTIELTNTFNYEGNGDLVLVVLNNSGKKGVQFYSKPDATGTLKALQRSANSKITDLNAQVNSSNRKNYRSAVRFWMRPEVPNTNAKNQTAYYHIPANAQCNDSYKAWAYVTDGNTCTSVTDTFYFGVGVEHAPTVTLTPAAQQPIIVYACGLDNSTDTNKNNTPVLTYDELASKGITVRDDCGKGMYLTYVDAAIVRGDCGDTLVRTYTVHNLCDSTVSFTQTFYSVDTTRPYFIDTLTNTVPYIRMLPVRAANCTYNAPTRAELVAAIQPFVFDNCTDMTVDYLMEHSEFYWENSEQFDSVKVVGSTDIFGPNVGNQLTVRTIVWDKCGNEANAVILYFNRPDSMFVDFPSIVNNIGQRPGICDDETFTLTFDSTMVKFPKDFTPKSPLTFEWENIENDVLFSNANGVETVVTPNQGDKFYHFRMHVTDAYGCDAYSELETVYVKASPNIAIIPDIRNGAEFPLCPTYGVLTIEAVDAETHTQVPNLDYTWSGESVNVWGSLTDTSSIYILPDRCSETYVARVDVVDHTYGCDAYATISVPVIDTVGPVYSGDVINDTVEVLAHCVKKVPDFIHYLNNSNLIDNCQPFSTFTFRQVPSAGTVITADTMVTIYVKTKCDNKEYPIKNMFFARIPENTIAVSVTAAPASGCSPTTFDITSAVENNIGAVTYSWKKNGTDINTNAPTLQEVNYVAAGQDSTDYVYELVVKDSKECKAEASVSVRVYMTPTTIDSTSQPNTHCYAPWNGKFILLNAPVQTEYELVMDADPTITYYRKSEVPASDPNVTETTVIFDFLPEGHGTLTVTTPKGCQSTYDINIRGNRAPVTIANSEYELSDPTTCKNNDGSIVLHPVAGYSYEITDAQGNVLDSYENLTNGNYFIKKTSNSTFCESDPLMVTLDPSAATLEVDFYTTKNTSCTEVKNGTIAFYGNLNSTYYTIMLGDELIATNIHGNPTVENLKAGNYVVFAADSASGCSTVDTAKVQDNTVNPSFTVTVTPNNYCPNEDNLVNGTLKVTKASSSSAAKVTYAYLGTNESPIPDDEAVYIDYPAFGYPQELAAGNYRVKAVFENTGCLTQKDDVIVNTYTYPELLRAEKTANTICDTTIADYDGTATIYIKNPTSTSIKPYKIVFDGDTTDALSDSSKKYDHLNAGTYTFSFISTYFCASQDYPVTVPQYEYPELAMHATPNTMCVPTFEHPGNGTIVMENPYRDIVRYDYSYYYANADKDSAGAQLQVNYFDMVNYTMYHLTDTLYFVYVYDKTKGCDIYDTITVPHSDDFISGSAVATANKNCKAPYDGTVTVTANAKHADGSANVDAVMMYSLVGVDNNMVYPYQFNNVFTGVMDGTYTAMVKDTTTGCAFAVATNVVVEKSAVDFVINAVISDNHSCEPALYDGALTATATSTLFTNTDFRYSLDVDGNYSETNTWTGIAGAHIVYVIDEVSGCKANDDFNVPTDNICAPIVTITPENNNNYNNTFGFCLNTENASLTASATANASCAQGEFEYRWVKACHNDTIYGPTVQVATDAILCCDYHLHVRSLATGCTTDSIVHVCVQGRELPVFISDHTILPNNSIEACQNDSVMIGIGNADKFTKIVWSNSYVTPVGVDKEESFKIYAADYPSGRMHTFCVDVEDMRGCTSRSQINFFTHDTAAVTVYDTACSFYNRWQRRNTTFEPITFTEDVRVNNATAYGCDSVYHYYHTILPEANADFTDALALNNGVFCVPSDILVRMYNAVTVNVGTLSLQKKTAPTIWTEVQNVQSINIDGAGTYRFVVTNGECPDRAVSQEFTILTDSIPVVNSLTLKEYYCTGTSDTIKANVSAFGARTDSVKIYLAGEPTKLLAATQYVHEGQDNYEFVFPMSYSAHNGKTVVVEAFNACGSTTMQATMRVDTDFINIQDITLCEDDTLNFANILRDYVQDYDNFEAYIMIPFLSGTAMPGGATLKYVDQKFNYVPAEMGYQNTLDVTGLVSGQNVPKVDTLNEYLSFSTAQGSANGRVKYYTSNGGHLRFLGSSNTYGNRMDIYGRNNALIRGINITAVNGYAPNIRINSTTSNVAAVNNVYNASFTGSTTNVYFQNRGSGSNGQLRVSSVEISYRVPYVMIPYHRGQAITVDMDNASVYFVGQSKCGEVTSNVVNIHVDSLPRIVANPIHHNLCKEAAADSIAKLVKVYAADEEAWMFQNVAGDTVRVESIGVLVDSLYAISDANVLYFAANGCDTVIKPVGNVRVLGKPVVTAYEEVTVCPNDKFTNPQAYVNASIANRANYRGYELVLTYYGKNNGDYHEMSTTDFVAQAAAQDTIMVVLSVNPQANVPSCGADTAFVRLQILTNAYAAPEMKPACPTSTLAQFIVEGKEPKWNGSATVTEKFWTIRMPNQTDSIVVDETAFVPVATTTATYTWITNCLDTIVTPEFDIVLYNIDTLKLHVADNDTMFICNNEELVLEDRFAMTVDPLIFTVVDLDNNASDTVWTLGGDTIKNGKIMVTYNKYNGAELIAFVNTPCGTISDTVIVMVDSVLAPEAKGDVTICLEGVARMQVVDPVTTSTYEWFVVNDEGDDIKVAEDASVMIYFDTIADNNDVTYINGNEVARAEFYSFYVVETNIHGCHSNGMNNVSENRLLGEDVITVKTTNAPQFVFMTPDSTPVRHFDLNTNEESNYLWMITGECPAADTMLYVEFYIYKDGQLIPDANIGDFFKTRTYNTGNVSKPWINSNAMSWETSTGQTTTRTMYHNSSVPGDEDANGVFYGNHFPNTNLVGSGSADYYDCLYYHFLRNRIVTSQLVPFRQAGEYKIVYQLWSTSNREIIQDLYTDEEGNLMYIGGYASMAGSHAVRTMIVEDSLTFTVTGENVAPVAEPVVEPSVAPALVVETVAPEMEVWPNPAPAITTTLKARVHHMAGDANVTLTNLTGKQIYNGNMYIDSDNYYFEVGVNNLSVGSYIMTVRTQDAVITKKVVVTSLAR